MHSQSPEALGRADIALHGVYEISKVLVIPGRLEVILSNVLTLLSSFLDMGHGTIVLLREDGSPRLLVGSGWSGESEEGGHSDGAPFGRLPERAVGQIVATQMPVVVPDVAASSLFAGCRADDWGLDEGRVSFIGVPIKDRSRVVGTLTIDRIHDGRAGFRVDEDVRFLVMIANLVGQTVRLQDLVARDRERLMEEQGRLAKALAGQDGARDARPQGIIGSSAAIRSVLEKISVAARSNSTVLLRGESGTGKELFARATHDLSSRRKGPFIKLNCAALPESVLESELFGHEKGAFTGALSQRKGRFELADGGTLFLDEIGEISAAFQAKLLRVLQEGEFERVGGMRTLKSDFRLVAATNRNLEEAVARGDFRADLYYRINVVPISLPPLRDRPEDIGPLAEAFVARFNEEHGTRLTLSASALAVLKACCFPGNVRELENCVRRTATLARGSMIAADDFACRNDTCLSSLLWKGREGGPSLPSHPAPFVRDPSAVSPATPAASPRPAPSPPGPDDAWDAPILSGPGPDERERILRAMETAGWVQAKAARLLNLTPRQIGYALRKYDIPIKRF
ncbi:MAG: nif-specific transcriptional activator NifA [Telmatospirillum sp.]|nr:nif-specific transcriptional activator NifA [Telmatospirillum sp.]